MARISTVIVAAVAGGTFGGAVVGVVCWLITRDLRPATVIVNVPPGSEVTRVPPDSPAIGWTHFDESRKGNDQKVVVQTNSVAVASSAPLTLNQPFGRASRNRELSALPDRTTKILNNIQAVAASSSTIQSYSVEPSSESPETLPADPASIDDALSHALEAADPFVKQGFTMREDYWGGNMSDGRGITIAHQLFKGNEYWFWAGTNAATGISVHAYDAKGNRAEAENWSRLRMGAARVRVKETGTYFLVVQFNRSVPGATQVERAAWAMAYGFR